MSSQDVPRGKIDVPHFLYHKIVYIPTDDLVNSILAGGLIPQVACEYKDLVPLCIRNRPIVWLAGRLNSYTDAPVFSVDVACLDLDNLHHVVDKDLDWFIYQGSIPIKALTKIRTLESLNL